LTDREAPRSSRLDEVLQALGLRPGKILRVMQRVAVEQGMPPISRGHFFELRMGNKKAREDTIRIVVMAVQEATGVPVAAHDLFNLGPGGEVSSVTTRIAQTWRTVVAEAPTSDSEFETLYVEYGILLRTIAMRGFGIPPDDAEALVHDCFIAYLQRHTSIHDIKAWLSGAMRNHCRHYLRDRKREAPLEAEHDQTVDPAPQAALERWMRRLTLAAVLARLGAKCRETLRSFYLSEEPKDALADRLSTSTGYIDQLLSTCRRRAHELFRSLTASRKDRR
jgi:RNA polymerase sigma factor (sigma-70 family)